MLRMCPICGTRVADGPEYKTVSGEIIQVCFLCFEIKTFLDGVHIDVRIDMVEDIVRRSSDETVFSRGLNSIIN